MRTKFTHLYKTFFSILIFTFSAGIVHAQKGTIKGVVKSDTGPLANASVILEGKNNGTTTNENGEYTLNIDPGTYNVLISYVGSQVYRKKVTVKANESVTADATLASSFTDKEIVLVGSRSAGRATGRMPP